MPRDGLLIVISGPSGTGKGALAGALKKRRNMLFDSISVTTRMPREGEIEGIDYSFRTRQQFEQMIKNDELLEWDNYCGNYYGTPVAFINEKASQGFDVLFEITIKGADEIIRRYPDCVSIFILPPSFDELRRRIKDRGTENNNVIEMRLSEAKNEILKISSYKYVIINDDLETAVNHLSSIIDAEKLTFARNKDLLSLYGYNQEV
ncbi:MAG: guanylate kinase [Clostridiales bacterium]|nr:guanylate kinase [Clostridiales bacterium]